MQGFVGLQLPLLPLAPPRPPTLAPPPEPRWKSPTTCSLLLRRVGWIGSSGRKEGGGRRGGSPVAKAPRPPLPRLQRCQTARGGGLGKGGRGELAARAPGRGNRRPAAAAGRAAPDWAGLDGVLGGLLPPYRTPPVR